MKLFNAIILCGLLLSSTALAPLEADNKLTRHLGRKRPSKFKDGDELRAAVAKYLSGNKKKVAQVKTKYGNRIGAWDVSSVQDFSRLFSTNRVPAAASFNDDITPWVVSSATNMANMFLGAAAFNQDISRWDVFKVINFGGMFNQATSFNQNLCNWNVKMKDQASDVPSVNGMFANSGCPHKDNPVFTTGATVDWSPLCYTCAPEFAKFNNGSVLRAEVKRYLSGDPDQVAHVKSTYGDRIGDWDVSLVQDFTSVFNSLPAPAAATFNEDISSWNVSSATTMQYMFYGAATFNQDISSWDVSKVTNFYGMFYEASNFNGDVSSWTVSSATNMVYMFLRASAFNQNLSNWDVSKVSNFDGMFQAATSFNGDISSWKVMSATIMQFMFFGAVAFNQDVSNWDVSNVDNFLYMFGLATSFNQNLCKWSLKIKDPANGYPDVRFMFIDSGCTNNIFGDPQFTATATFEWSPLCYTCA